MWGKSNFKVKSGKNEVWRKEQENECNLKDDENFLENAVIMFGLLDNDFFRVWISGTELIVNPFTLKISSVILPTVCYSVLMI